MIQIRHAKAEEIDKLMETGGYPTREIVEKDMGNGNCYVCLDPSGEIIGTFAFIQGEEPAYTHIYEGRWLDAQKPYATIHRLASTAESHGVAAACLEWCARQIPNLRADTHRDNHILQHILLKHGFTYCGIIYLQNGDERLAYQKIILP